MRSVLRRKQRQYLSLLFGTILALSLSLALLMTYDEMTAAPPVPIVSLSVGVADEIDEPGGVLTYTVEITNNFPIADVVLTSLYDSLYGDLTDSVNPQLNSTTCSLGVIAPTETYLCEFTAQFLGDAGAQRTTTITATGETSGGATSGAIGLASLEKTIMIVDVAPVISVAKIAVDSIFEPGAIVEYKVRVRNNSATTDLVQLTKLEDDLYGDLTNIANPLIIDSDCTLANINPGASNVCRFRALVLGNAGDTVNNVVSAQASDNEGTASEEAQAEHLLTIEDRLPDISISKAALPPVIPETGASVGFRIRIINNSPEEANLTALTDSLFGNLDGVGDCVADGSIVLAGDTPITAEGDNEYICTFNRQISGDFGGANHTNIATATVVDDEENSKSESDGATVVFTDSLPSISVEKKADPAQIPEAGADVTFSIEVTNETAEEVAIDSLIDSVYGNLREQGECTADTDTLVPGNGIFTCSFTRFVSGDFGGSPHQNTITVTAADDEGNQAVDDAAATVTFLDSLPQIVLSKDATPASVPEPGGMVTFTIEITNSTVEDVTLHSLTDNIFGDLDGVGDCIANGTGVVAGNDVYRCTFAELIAGNGGTLHVNTVQALTTDDEENEAIASDSATVEIVNSPSAIQLVVNADPTSVAEYGGTVRYNVSIENDSSTDIVTISTLTEATWGDLTKTSDTIVSTTCQMPQTLATNDSKQSVYDCEFSAAPIGNAGTSVVNTFDVSGTDDDDDVVTDSASITINFTNAPAPLQLSVLADPKSIPDGGADVAFSLSVQNNSPIDSVTLTELSDSNLGDLTETTSAAILTSDCSLPQALGPNLAYTCKFTASIPGEGAGAYVSTVRARGMDDDDSAASGTAELKVLVAQPLLVLTKEDLLFVDADRNFAVTPGDTIFYRITMRNDGNAPATGVTVEDTLDPNTKLIPGTVMTELGTADVDDNGTVVAAIGTLQAEQQVTVSFQIIFTPGEATTQIENQAIVKFDDPLPGSTRRISVNSDDPDTKDARDKTLTPVMGTVDPNGIIFLPVISR